MDAAEDFIAQGGNSDGNAEINADYISRAGTHGVDDVCSGGTVDVVVFVFFARGG